MSWRNVVGVLGAAAVFALFGLYTRTHEITAVSGFVFGGGLLFAGVLIDADHFAELFKIWKGGGDK